MITKLVRSSANPDKVSLTLKGLIAFAIVYLVQYFFGVSLDQGTAFKLSVDIIEAVTLVVTAFGLIRKVYFAIKKQPIHIVKNAILGALVLGMAYNPTPVEKVRESSILSDYEAFKIEVGEILDDLSYCESGDNSHALNPDDGGSRSVGRYQFKDETFKMYVRAYNLLEHVEDEELKNWMWDGSFQRELVSMMLYNRTDNIHHWENCNRKFELKGRLIDIKNTMEENKVDNVEEVETEEAEEAEESEEETE